jgi:hypothetical protein
MSASLKYNQFLRTDCWWNQTRLCCMERAGYYCEVMVMNVRGVAMRCPRVATEVHHLTYVRLGREKPEDLLAVCSAHHRALHNRPAKPRAANDNQLELPMSRLPGKVEMNG